MIRAFAALLLALSFSAGAQTTIGPVWAKVSELWINTEPPRQYIGPLFVNSYNGMGPAAGTWQTVDLTLSPWNLPTNARWASLRGLLIITGGTTDGTADLGVIFRTPGDTRVACTTPNYTGQTVQMTQSVATDVNGLPAAQTGQPRQPIVGGQRTNLSTWVPLQNGRVEWCWTRSTTGEWPTNNTYGVNMSVEAWAR